MSVGIDMLPEGMRPPTSRLHQVEYIELDDSDEEPVSLESEQGDEEELRDEEIEEDYDLVSAGQSGDQGDDAISISSGISAPAISDDFADVLNPLRNTADRVATSIELFAQNLDKFKRQSLQPNDPEAFRVACDLVKKYRTIAEHSVQDLSKNNALARAKQLASRATGVASASNLANEEQAIRWKLEAETWDLLLELLDMHNPDKLQKSKETMKSAFEGLHRYSSDQDVWRKFLEVDHYALENVVILKWLEKSTRSLPHNALDFTIADLKRRADRGQGVWTRGWLNSKETIKAAKRFRANPEPLQPGDPAMTSPMLATDQSASQVTQLDPDAVTRQQRILQRQDELFEQATWLTIWKMLREGQGWSKIRQWASERLENWRAVSVCGAATKSNNDSFDDSLTRMMSCRSLDSWRLACHALANNPQVDQFERAVYALLCGETEPAYAACQGWSDHLYVYLNSVILTRYRDFCRQFQRKLTNSTGETVICKIADPDLEGLQKHLEAIRQNEKVKAEARNPYRTIQSAIISHQYDVFFYRQANALTKIAADSKRPTLVPKVPTHVDEESLIAARNEAALRITAHLFAIVQTLGYLRPDAAFIETASINVVGYINYLQKINKPELIPLYVSVLPLQAGHNVLGKVLINVTRSRDRQTQIKLMRRYSIDIVAVLESQWKWVLAEALANEDQIPIRLRRTVIRSKDGHIPKIVSMGRNFVGRRISRESENLIRCLEWHRYAEGTWAKVCMLGTFLYKKFLTSGHLAEARMLLARAPLTQLSLDMLGYDVTLNPEFLSEPEGLSEDNAAGDSTPTQEKDMDFEEPAKQSQRKRLYVQAQTMHDLEILVDAFEGLENWSGLLEKLEHMDNPVELKDLQRSMRDALNELTAKVNPLFDADWLDNPQDRPERTELDFIRTTYLPEVVLAYHHALYTAGQSVAREILTECMELSVTVAGTPALVEAFMAAGRMRELTDAFAVSSLALVEASAKKSSVKKRLPHEATMDIWTVSKKAKTEA